MDEDPAAMTVEAELTLCTVTGVLDPAALPPGPTLCSEHLFWDPSKILVETAPDKCPLHRGVQLSLEIRGELIEDPESNLDNVHLTSADAAEYELRAFKEAGGVLVVDTTVSAFGRNPRGLRTLSQTTGVPIVMGCGHGIAASHSAFVAGESVESLAAAIEREVVGGVVESDEYGAIRAGVIGAIGVSAEPREQELRVLASAARAQAATGAALMVHCAGGPGSGHAAQHHLVLDTIAQAGGDVARTCLLNCGVWCEDRALLRALLARGCRLAMDCVGAGGLFLPRDGSQLPADDRITACVAALAAEGLAGQLLLSHGYFLKMHLSRGGGAGHAHIPRRFLPRLRRAGVSDADLGAMTRHNLLALLCFKQPPPPTPEASKLWLCDACGNGFPDTHEAFTKFSYALCSPKCLKAMSKRTDYWTRRPDP